MRAEQWPALATAVRRRREEMRLAQADLAGRGGPGEVTVRKIELGEPTSIRSKTKTQLEHALAWPDGAVDRILDGTATAQDMSPPREAPRPVEGGAAVLYGALIALGWQPPR